MIFMKLLLKGYLPSTLIDWPGKISAVIFVAGCNFRCGFCHNPELVIFDPQEKGLELEPLLEDLKKRKKWLDGVVITGGEPTLYQDLPLLIKKIKALGFLVKLDTNGTNFKMLKDLVSKKLIDYVAMDIKAPLEDYPKTIGVAKFNWQAVKKSVEFLLKDQVDYEFRTTLVPELIGKEELKKIGQWIKGAKRYYLQPFRPLKTLDPAFQQKRSYLKKELDSLLKIIKPYVQEAAIRGF